MKRAAAFALGTALCAVVAVPAMTQAQSRSAAPYKVAHLSWGVPDLQGYWTNASLTPERRPRALGDKLNYTEEEVAKIEGAAADESAYGNEPTDPNAPPPPVGGELDPNVRPEFAAAGGNVGGYNLGWLDPGNHVMRVNGQGRTSILTTANGQVPPRKEGAPRPTFQRPPPGGAFDDPERRSLGERCILSFGRNAGPPMLANGFYNNDYRIVQTPDAVVIQIEMVHDTRVVRLNSKHRTDGLRPWFGDSIGWYDGDTLVVETTNIPQELAYNGSWENLKVTERFTRVGQNRLLYKFTVEDPTVWDQPWGGEYEFSPMNGIIYEYACHEGNYALEGMLAGARAEDADAAGKTPPPSALADPVGRAN